VSGAVLASVIAILVLVAVAGVIVALVTDDRDPSILLAWLFVILLVPVLGVVAYFFLGRNQRRQPRRRPERGRAPRQPDHVLAPTLADNREYSAAVATRASGSVVGRLEGLGRRQGGPPPLPAEDVRLYFAGADKFRDLLADLAAARSTVHLMYLIWEQDELTAEVTRVLLDRVAAGVRVHVIYDWLSSLPYRKQELERLAAAGAAVVPCYRRPRRLNYRNHMKMAVIDGLTVYSGGMNMGQEYIDGGRRFETWRDTHVRMSGPVVAPYLALFEEVWVEDGHPGEPLADVAAPGRTGTPEVPVQVLHSSVSTPFPTLRDAFVLALTGARWRVWIQSPYFVPDEPLLTAMCVAAAGGVDVRLMMTGRPDKKIPFHAAHAYFPTVLAAGVRVHLYDAGFLHAKTVVVDDEVAVVGTCNWDIRSLVLHDEVVSVFYDREITLACAEQFEVDLGACTEMTDEVVAGLGAPRRLRNSVCRLSSRLL
jgi:cardiolipin synthase